MKLGYDIFRKLDDGSPLWVAHIASLEEAQKKLEALQKTSPGHYFVRDAESGVLLGDEAPEAHE